MNKSSIIFYILTPYTKIENQKHSHFKKFFYFKIIMFFNSHLIPKLKIKNTLISQKKE